MIITTTERGENGGYKIRYYVAGEGNASNGLLNNGNAYLVKAHVLPNTLVELSNGPEVRRRITDEKGTFGFEAPRPGK
jgi:hypothetical protein